MSTYYFNIDNNFILGPPPYLTINNPGDWGMFMQLISGGTLDGVQLQDGDVLRLKGTRTDASSLPFIATTYTNITITSWEDNEPYFFKIDSNPYLNIIYNMNNSEITIQNGIFDSIYFDDPSTTNKINTIKMKNCIIYNQLNSENITIDFNGCTFNDVNPFDMIEYPVSAYASTFNFYDCVFIDSMVSDLGVDTAAFNFQYNTFTDSQQDIESELSASDVILFENDYDWVPLETLPNIDSISADNIIYDDYGVTVTTTDDRSSIWLDDGIDIGFYENQRIGRGAFNFFKESDEENRGHIGSFYFGPDYENIEIDIEVPILEIEVMDIGVSVSNDILDIPTLELEVLEVDTRGVICVWANFDSDVRFGTSPLVVNFQAKDYIPNVACLSACDVSEFIWFFDYGNNPQISAVREYGDIENPNDTIQHIYCGHHGESFDVRLQVIYVPKE